MRINYFCMATVIITLFTLTSCDPMYDIEYIIDNQSDYKIIVISETDYGDKDTSIISDNTKLIFWEDSDISCYTEDYLANIKSLPFYSIFITTTNDLMCKVDENDIDNWIKVYPQEKHGRGQIVFKVYNNFF